MKAMHLIHSDLKKIQSNLFIADKLSLFFIKLISILKLRV